jgi:hypothetical protein
MHRHATSHFCFCLLSVYALLPLDAIASCVYRVVKQASTPPPLKYKPSPIGLIWFLKDFLGALACFGITITNLLATNYVQVCTTKYIFWLGKNKFVRIWPGLVIAGLFFK